MSPADTERIARAWMDAFNAHDVDRLMGLYAERCTHTSPKIRLLYPETGGLLLGKDALRRWWKDALQRVPTLRYELSGITCSADRAIVEYVRHAHGESPLPVAEVFDVQGGFIAASRVYHG